jgi:hypothetical protein
MAKAKYHKSQRVFVKPVGTWAHIEQIVPKWVRGCEEPIKVMYDCGMGREFAQEELEEETTALQQTTAVNGMGTEWHLLRGQNRWKSAEQCGHHPYPGTHPVIATTERDWGGWRVPGAEYDLDPHRIEQQAQLLVRAPVLFALLSKFVEQAKTDPENFSSTLLDLAQLSGRVIEQIDQTARSETPEETEAEQATEEPRQTSQPSQAQAAFQAPEPAPAQA